MAATATLPSRARSDMAMTDNNKKSDPAQEFLDKVSPLGTPLSEEDSKHHQQLLREAGLVVGTGDALKTPPNHRFAPLATKPQKI